MEIYKRGDTWHCSYFGTNGERVRRSTRCTDRKAAEARARQWERDAADPESAARRDATLDDALKLLLRQREEQARAGRRSTDTAVFYRKKSGHLVRVFETEVAGSRKAFPLVRLTPREVDRYVSQRRAEGASESTIHKELVTLRAALKLARRAGIWVGDPAALIPVAFAPDYKPRTRFLTRDELARLLAEVSPDRAARVAFMVATSSEWSATTRARHADVATDLTSVRIRGTKRSMRDRVVPIATKAQQELLKYALAHAAGEEGLLFVPWNNNVVRDLHAACRRAGIPPCSPNDLRRTFATWLRAAGAPTDLIAPVMGHADTRMVERVYGRLSPSDLRRRIMMSVSDPAVTPVCQTPWTPSDFSDGSDGVSTNASPRKALDSRCPETELNRRHGDFQSPALPTELSGRRWGVAF
jgi:integrase